MKTKKQKSNIVQPVVSSSADFEEAVSLFQLYKPVKIARPLRDEFHNFISRHFMNMGVEKWSATIYPQVKSYKFQRT
jgi:hypothetical protein